MRMVDCQGLGGAGIILGGVQAGFEMVHRVALPGGFGNQVVDHPMNRQVLGFTGEIETGPGEEWTPQKDIAYVAGVPPCSGFSLMNTTAAVAKAQGKEAPANARGAGSAINLCQRELVEYAAKTTGTDGKLGPEFVVFESVQGAFSNGLELMREYWTLLTLRTGQPYELTHVKMSVASIGGAQYRHRYFWVAHRVPFGIAPSDVKELTTIWDAIADLRGEPEDWDVQPRADLPQSEYARRLADTTFVTAHQSMHGRAIEAMEDLIPYWEPGKAINAATKKFIAANGLDALPEHLAKRWNNETGLYKGFMWPFRPAWDEPSPVLTGGCAQGPMHAEQPRFFTVRELARIMDIPDSWSFDAARSPAQAGMWIGKNCTAGAGKWIADAIRDALEGRPQDSDHEFMSVGYYKKDKLDLQPGERVYDITNLYRTFPNYVRRRRSV